MVIRSRTLCLFGIILIFLYSWKFFLPDGDYQGVSTQEATNHMIIPQDILDQAAHAELLHDVKIAEQTVTTSTSTTNPSEWTTETSPQIEAVSATSTSSPPTTTSTTSASSQEHDYETSTSQIPVQSMPPQEASIPSFASGQNTPPEAQKQEIEASQQFDSDPKTPQQFFIEDNFPFAQNVRSKADLPPIPPWNAPPSPHVKERTPLFIAFTRNWRLLQQTVVAWITSGWPAEDIYVVENTGTMRSNELGHLSLQNPFFLNHTRLHLLGVNVIVTPTLYTFAQLQNFFLWIAIEKDIDHYFWSHMDIVPITFEDDTRKEDHYAGHRTIYQHAVDVLRQAQSPDPDPNASDPSKPWAMRFFAFDYLTLVNRAAFEAVGGFDTTIPFYHTDCDMYDRLLMAGYEMNEPRHLMSTIGNDFVGTAKSGSGYIYDVANSLDDLIVLYRLRGAGEASFTDQTRPEDVENARKKAEAEAEQEAQYEADRQAEAQYDAEMQAQAEAHAQIDTKAQEEQAQLDAKAQKIMIQEETAQSGGQVQDNSAIQQNVDTQQAEMDHPKASEQKTEIREEDSNTGASKGSHRSGSSISSSKPGDYKRDLESSNTAETKSIDTAPRNSQSSKIPHFPSKKSPQKLNWLPDSPGSPNYWKLLDVANSMVMAKYSSGGDGRNTWQRQQTGGQGEPYYRNPDGFEKAIQMTITLGRSVYLEKWGTLECGLILNGVTKEDEWKDRNLDPLGQGGLPYGGDA